MVQKGKQKGYQLEHELARGLKLDSTLQWKIPDAKTLGVPIPHKVPADFIINSPNGLCFIECKATAQGNRIPKRNFKPHQIDTARQLPDAYFFVIDFYNGRQHDIFLIKGDSLAMLYDINTSSITKEEIANLSYVLHRDTASKHPDGDGAFIRGVKDGILKLR